MARQADGLQNSNSRKFHLAEFETFGFSHALSKKKTDVPQRKDANDGSTVADTHTYCILTMHLQRTPIELSK